MTTAISTTVASVSSTIRPFRRAETGRKASSRGSTAGSVGLDDDEGDEGLRGIGGPLSHARPQASDHSGISFTAASTGSTSPLVLVASTPRYQAARATSSGWMISASAARAL